MIAAQTDSKVSTPDVFTVVDGSIHFNGVELLDQKHLTTEVVARALNYAHAVGEHSGVQQAREALNLSSAHDARLQGKAAPLSHPTRREGRSPNPHVAQAALATAIEDGGETYPGAIPTSLPGYASGTVRTGNERRNEVRP